MTIKSNGFSLPRRLSHSNQEHTYTTYMQRICRRFLGPTMHLKFDILDFFFSSLCFIIKCLGTTRTLHSYTFEIDHLSARIIYIKYYTHKSINHIIILGLSIKITKTCSRYFSIMKHSALPDFCDDLTQFK